MSDIYTILRKLMAHEQSARKIGSIAEAEAFAAKIQQLLIDHKIEMSSVSAKETVQASEPISEHTVGADSLGYGNVKKRWRYLKSLASVVARAHFCEVMVSDRGGTIWFVGKREDRQLAEEIFRHLATLGIELASKALRVYDGPSERWPYLLGFYDGYTSAIYRRYLDQEEKAKASSSQAIVLFQTSKTALSAYVKQRARVVKERSSRRNTSIEGWIHGLAAGKSVALTSKALE